MNRTRTLRRQPIALVALILSALLGVTLASGAAAARANGTSAGAPALVMRMGPPVAARDAFHDQMRKLWEDHITWTRLAIVTFADGSPSFGVTAGRLLQNQSDIGDAIKPFYGDAAGDRLTALLHDHITIAVEILQAAKIGDTDAFNAANTRWYANGNDIADFLATANPRSWPDDVMRADMKEHLDQTLTEASDELHGQYASSVTDYEGIHAHILMMADQLSAGIIAQFPSRFR
ncbi:hypothetical protein DDP54_05735 [Cellulomonas sp. WB94]|uniref:hypothetical protein n=1 Tax=Cellulomonas sp. WB94 TaxID=2173174 RepID=UPI000D57D70B|nr:hypothetical protein [Cellulomonas sp. WB94]PVU82581.1 hypothetical protein DDP54_05735 [Cellulomonas sp. WB94]